MWMVLKKMLVMLVGGVLQNVLFYSHQWEWEAWKCGTGFWASTSLCPDSFSNLTWITSSSVQVTVHSKIRAACTDERLSICVILSHLKWEFLDIFTSCLATEKLNELRMTEHGHVWREIHLTLSLVAKPFTSSWLITYSLNWTNLVARQTRAETSWCKRFTPQIYQSSPSVIYSISAKNKLSQGNICT